MKFIFRQHVVSGSFVVSTGRPRDRTGSEATREARSLLCEARSLLSVRECAGVCTFVAQQYDEECAGVCGAYKHLCDSAIFASES